MHMLIQLVGLALIVTGVAHIYPPAALIVAGAILVSIIEARA